MDENSHNFKYWWGITKWSITLLVGGSLLSCLVTFIQTKDFFMASQWLIGILAVVTPLVVLISVSTYLSEWKDYRRPHNPYAFQDPSKAPRYILWLWQKAAGINDWRRKETVINLVILPVSIFPMLIGGLIVEWCLLKLMSNIVK